jgi:glycosyltransferase involved in cell wall biosynthesis
MPEISVVICTYNREKYLPVCLNHLRNQTASKEVFEIVIINNNSSDATESICKKFILENPTLNITYALETNPGLSHARNKGIELSKGEIICFIDDDGFAMPNYIEIIQLYTTNTNYDDYISFGGKVIPCFNEGMEPIWLSKYIDGVVSKVDLGDKVKDFDKKYPAGCNMIFRKEFFEKHGVFNADLHTRGDDKFVFDKLKKAGLKTLYIPELKVNHFIDDYRLEQSFIQRLSKIIGQSEAIRLQNKSILSKIKKVLEYILKFMIAGALAIGFIFQSQPQKAKFILIVRWYVLLGYFIKSKI